MLQGMGLLLLGGGGGPPGGAAVLLLWLALYAASALAEEGLALAGAPPQPQPLRPGLNPFWDYVTPEPRVRCVRNATRVCTAASAQPMTSALSPSPRQNAVERARMYLMAPVVVVRCCIFWGTLITYGTSLPPRSSPLHRRHAALLLTSGAGRRAGLFVSTFERAVSGGPVRRAALLQPITRISVSIVLWLCGYSVRPARAARHAMQRWRSDMLRGRDIIAASGLHRRSMSPGGTTSLQQSAPRPPPTAPSPWCVMRRAWRTLHTRTAACVVACSRRAACTGLGGLHGLF
jgi:hypothetical protein